MLVTANSLFRSFVAVHFCWQRRSSCSSCAWFWSVPGAFSWQYRQHCWYGPPSLGNYSCWLWKIRETKCQLFRTFLVRVTERLYYWCCEGTCSSCWQLYWRYRFYYKITIQMKGHTIFAQNNLNQVITKSWWSHNRPQIFSGYICAIAAGLWPSLAMSLVLLNSAGSVVPNYSFVPLSEVRQLIFCILSIVMHSDLLLLYYMILKVHTHIWFYYKTNLVAYLWAELISISWYQFAELWPSHTFSWSCWLQMRLIKNIPSNFFFKKSFRLNLLVGNIILSCNTFTFHSYWNLHDIYSLIWLMYAFFCLKHFYVPVGYKWDFKKLPCKLNLWLVIFVRLCGMRELYCLSPFGWLYRSTWHGEQVASPRDKEGYPGITINLKLTISGGA